MFLATAVGVSLGEADQVITPTYIFLNALLDNKALKLNSQLILVLQIRYHIISSIHMFLTWHTLQKKNFVK